MTVRLDQRKSGILLHPSALPSRFGIGDLGPAAYRFVDWLAASGQRYWQILPLLLPDPVGSPYASNSAFAGNWLLISPERLVSEGYLDKAKPWSKENEPVHYPLVGQRKAALLERAHQHLQEDGTPGQRRRYRQFRNREKEWLHDVALYNALKEHFGFEVPWTRWPQSIRTRRSTALRMWRRTLRSRIDFYMFLQWQFDEQWRALKRYANKKGIAIIGDLPMYVTRDSADTWAEPENFMLDPLGRPRLVSGVPPDYFSNRGQIWGDPLYNWDHLRRERFGWWMKRFRRSFMLYDVVRLDHFRGYVAVWGMRAGSRSARRGSWHPVPGRELLTKARKVYRGTFIAEDLGFITDDVNTLRNDLGLPGVRIMQFGFERTGSIHHLDNLNRRCVAYTGSHDNNTTRGWFIDETTSTVRRMVGKHFRVQASTVASSFIRALERSVVNTVIIPLQDVLNLGSAARFNTPGKREGNWSWRFKQSDLTPSRAAGLRRLAMKTGRL